MKKLTFITVLTVFLCSIFMTSCGVLEQTHDTWYKYQRQDKLDLPIHDGEDESSDIMLEDADLYLCYNRTNGLKICFVTTHEQTIQYGGSYSPIEVKADIVTGGTKQFKPEQFGAGSWDILVISGKISPEDPPKISVDISEAFEDGKFKPELILSRLIMKWAEENS